MQKFFFYGHLVAGPNWRASIGTAILLLAPAGIFIAFVASYLTLEVHAIIMVFRCGFGWARCMQQRSAGQQAD